MLRCSKYSTTLVVLAALATLLITVAADVLVDSGSPMQGGNPQRNRHVNRKLLCPEVAPGRTQIWNVAWKTRLSDGLLLAYNGMDMTQDENGLIYIAVGENNGVRYIKYNVDGTVSSSFTASFMGAPTHIPGKSIFAGETQAEIMNSTSMQVIAAVDWPTGYTYYVGSFAPLSEDIMVTSQEPVNYFDQPLLRYFNISSQQFVDLPGPNGSKPLNVIVYNNNGVNMPIIVSNVHSEPAYVWSPNYNFSINGGIFYVNPYVQNDQLVIHYNSGEGKAVNIYNAATGALISNYVVGNASNDITGEMVVIGDKSAAAVYQVKPRNLAVVDFINKKTLVDNKYFEITPSFSIPDQSALFSGVDNYPNGPSQLFSIDWVSGSINAVGNYPSDASTNVVVRSAPLVGENCTVYQIFADAESTYNHLFAFKPLPISNIQPILECITDTGVGYFSSKNMENIDIIIPFAKDRNNITPMNVAGAIDFKANQRGKYFPFSTPVALDNNTNSFTWQLEDYVLSFAKSNQLRCPENVSAVLSFSTETALPDFNAFAGWLKQQLADFTNSNVSRFIVSNVKGNGLNVTITLQILRGDFGDYMTPEQIAQTFAAQLKDLTQQIQLDQTYSSYLITIRDYNGVGPLSTEISGTIPPRSSQIPTGSNSPKTSSISHGNALQWCAISGVLATISMLGL